MRHGRAGGGDWPWSDGPCAAQKAARRSVTLAGRGASASQGTLRRWRPRSTPETIPQRSRPKTTPWILLSGNVRTPPLCPFQPRRYCVAARCKDPRGAGAPASGRRALDSDSGPPGAQGYRRWQRFSCSPRHPAVLPVRRVGVGSPHPLTAGW